MSTWVNSATYNINTVYKELIGSSAHVSWSKLVWHRTSLPKARFIFWMAMLNKLKTKDHLMRIDVTPDDCCPLCCTACESIAHFNFLVAVLVVNALISWLHGLVSIASLWSIHPSNWKVSCFMRKIAISSVRSLIYQIWRARNDCIWHARVISAS